MSKLVINENPEFSTEMEALTPNTPAHADQFNVRYQQILNNEKANRRDAKIFEDDINAGNEVENDKKGFYCRAGNASGSPGTG